MRYRKARSALAAEEIELRRHVARVAEMRRALPPGGDVTKNWCFECTDGPVGLAALFGEQQPLIVHRLCTDSSASSLPHAHDANECWAGIARHLKQRVAFAMVARSSIARILAYGRERRWNNLKLCSNPGGACTRDYVSAEAEDMPVCSVFHRTDGAIRQFWSSEGGSATADPGQNPHGAPDRSAL